MRFSEEMSLPDKNPELVSYLQGDWSLTGNPNTVIRIKRDSIITIYNDTVKSAHNLSYLFNEAASRYFTKDSSFDFHSANGKDLSSSEFKLMEVDKRINDTIYYILVYVSKSGITMNSREKSISLTSVK